ncbi:hypothetical protein [Streptomyces sp. NE5-10]|nr:hypothetical protein [Streptomyces sp. NE5-10]
MPEQLLAPQPADPDHDDQEQKPGRSPSRRSRPFTLPGGTAMAPWW